MRTLMTTLLIPLFAIAAGNLFAAEADAKIKALIVDGQNNHSAWPKTTAMMKQYLEDSGRFTVAVARTAFTWRGGKLVEQYPLPGVETTEKPKALADPNFKPDFSQYDVVISNFGFGAAPWPKETQSAFVEFVRGGGGFVVVHAADNSFGDWPEYNQMIGVGGWGGRSEKSGPYVYLKEDGTEVRDTGAGRAGSHGPQHEFQIVVRNSSHPITAGMPPAWMHAQDELYDHLRGPAENMTVLATAFASKDKRGSGNHAPMIMTIEYGKGRVFHTPMGHADYSMQCVGFITTLLRGTEWAATGEVSTAIPDDFPTADAASSRN